MPTGMPQFELNRASSGWTGQTGAEHIPNQGWNIPQDNAGQLPVQVQVNGQNEGWSTLNGHIESSLADQAKLWNRSPVVSMPATNVMTGLNRSVEDPNAGLKTGAEGDQLLQNAQLNATQAMLNEYQQLHQLQLLQVSHSSC